MRTGFMARQNTSANLGFVSAALVPGSIFARDYRIVAPLGQGGMGTLYVAEQISPARSAR